MRQLVALARIGTFFVSKVAERMLMLISVAGVTEMIEVVPGMIDMDVIDEVVGNKGLPMEIAPAWTTAAKVPVLTAEFSELV
mmetsp:Transcript_12577/g.17191  ORF Transcript_12577/g.17191 Transcript_12577/m.17191 type:complete len:82 (+) Transcript_12577:522-767(+)